MRDTIIRLIAWFCDLLLASIVFNYLLSFSYFNKYFLDISYSFNSFGISTLGSNQIALFILVYILSVFLRFYGTILLGRSFSQMIFGIRPSSSFLWARIGGGLRCALELLIPLSLFDPILLFKKKKTLKESILACNLKTSDSYLQIISTLTYLPICIVLAISSPLFQNLSFIDGITLGFSNEKLETLDNRTDFSKFRHYPSESFKMSSFSSIESSNQKLIPSFEITREKNKKRIRPYLVIHDLERKVFGELKLKKRFSLRVILKLISEHDPLFATFYPELYKINNRSEDRYAVQKYKDKFGDKKSLNPLAREELRQLVQSSFELSYTTLFEHIIKKGPFLSGHIRVRNYLFSLIDSEVDSTVDLVKLGNYVFLRFKQSFKSLEAIEKGNSETYIPIETLNSAVIELNWGNSRKDAFARNDFKERFLNSTKWFFDYKAVFIAPSEISDFNVFTIMDFFTLKGLDDNFVAKLEQFTFGYLFEISKTAIRTNNDGLKNSILATSNRILLLMSYKKKRIRTNKKSSKFVRMISDLKNAVKNNNVKYFEN
jgi:hypothetical protein